MRSKASQVQGFRAPRQRAGLTGSSSTWSPGSSRPSTAPSSGPSPPTSTSARSRRDLMKYDTFIITLLLTSLIYS